MYKEKSWDFLVDPRDGVDYYEKQASKGVPDSDGASGSVVDAGMKALQSMDRTKQIEMIHG